MTAERFRQIRHVFDAAVEREPNARAAFLAEACRGDEELEREVEHLLRAREQEITWLDQQGPEAGGRLEGRRIGAYEILRSLGEGGMGTVYLAVRSDGAFRKLVALKVVRPERASTEVLRRFQQEREILASLEHPNIARILDGGETGDGLPYLVMEYVDGKPIDIYCDERRLNVRERLALFEAVCSAVQYAHTKQVVHRDLKPSNILVTEAGEVKLLDFGIATLLAANEGITLLRTRSDLRLMTPEYASPEQVRGERVTTSSDIYSLGVLLYEILTGHKPYRLHSRIYSEVVRVICEETPSRPSTMVTQQGEREGEQDREPEALSRKRGVSPKQLRSELAGDLDGILLKTLEKDPRQRYRSVTGLSGDLQGHIRGECVRVRRQSVGAFLRRHEWIILAVVALVLMCWNGWISNFVLLVAAPLVVSVPFGIWLSHREFGTIFPNRFFVGMSLKNFAVAGLMVLLTYSLARGPLRLDLGGTARFSAATAVVWMLYIVLRWPLRSKLLGPVLVDASRNPNKLLVTTFAVCFLLQAFVGVMAYRDDEAALHSDSQPFLNFQVENLPPGAVQSGLGHNTLPIIAYAVLSEQKNLFENVIAFAPLSKVPQEGVPIGLGSKDWTAFGDEVSGNFFSDLRVSAYLGRILTMADDSDRGRVVVLNYAWWRRELSSDPRIVGRPLYIKGSPFIVIGVAPKGFNGVNPYYVSDFWIPLQASNRFVPWGESPKPGYSLYGSPEWYCLMLIGRLQPGVSAQDAVARLTSTEQRSTSTGEIVSFDPKRSRLYFSPAPGVMFWIAQSKRDQIKERLGYLLAQISFPALFMVFYALLFPRVEFRARGLAAAGMFVRWQRVDGYTWAPFGEFEMLRFRMNGPMKWWPIPMATLLRRNLREQVEKILQQQLMEWPN